MKSRGKKKKKKKPLTLCVLRLPSLRKVSERWIVFLTHLSSRSKNCCVKLTRVVRKENGSSVSTSFTGLWNQTQKASSRRSNYTDIIGCISLVNNELSSSSSSTSTFFLWTIFSHSCPRFFLHPRDVSLDVRLMATRLFLIPLVLHTRDSEIFMPLCIKSWRGSQRKLSLVPC